MGNELAARVEALEGEAKKLHRWVLVLGAALVGCVAVGVSQPQELTLRKLTIVDGEGRPRIIAGATSSGTASLNYYDSDEKLRMSAATMPDGSAFITHFDRDEIRRITAATTSDGSAFITHFDRNEIRRITAATPDGSVAAIQVRDSSGNVTWGESSE